MKSVAIVGSGPAALIAADLLSANGYSVTLFEKRSSIGRKLLVAGSSGLNITNDLPLDTFVANYRQPGSPGFWRQIIGDFPAQAWIQYIESLGIETFKGSTGRYFIEDKKAAKFLQTWKQKLMNQGVSFQLGMECVGFKKNPTTGEITLQFANNSQHSTQIVCFALGGASWEPNENPLRWPNIFTQQGIKMDPFLPSNVGYEVNWNTDFLKEAEGLPLKNISLTTPRGTRSGELSVTAYGLEGTPIYSVGQAGVAILDLKPDLTEAEITTRLTLVKENLSPIRRIKRQLSFCPASQALIFHFLPKSLAESTNWSAIAKEIKSFPVHLVRARPISEAISSSGGVSLSELDENFMLRRFPSIYCMGEMLSWDAPTGGFLIQGCVSQGHWVARAIIHGKRTHL